MTPKVRGQSGSGRRRATDADIAEILRWVRARESKVQLAARLNLSVSTVSRIARSLGTHYKTRSPEVASAVPVPPTIHES